MSIYRFTATGYERIEMTLPFGIDISFWQEEVSFDKMAKADPKTEFIGIRVGQGTYGIDSQFERNWELA